MASQVASVLADVERARKSLNRIPGAQLHSLEVRAGLRQVAERYFNELRPTLEDEAMQDTHRDGVDAAMRELLALCHKRGSVQKYKDLLRTAKGHLIHLDTGLVTRGDRQPDDVRTAHDVKIVTTLRALLPSAAASYEQALVDLAEIGRLSWRGPAADLREALRETLDHLAPDADVIGSAGYRQEPAAHGPTMKQKVRYILKNRGKSTAGLATAEDATSAIDEAMGRFVRSVYTRSSVSTHIATDRGEVLRVLDLVRVVLGDLLETR